MLGKMTRDQQQWLSDNVQSTLETFKATHGLEPVQMIYWLVSFTWGYAKRQGWETRQIASYSLLAFEQCQKFADAHQPPPPGRVG